MSVVLFYAAATDFDCHSLFDTFEKEDFGYIYKRLMSGNVGTMVYIVFHSRYSTCFLHTASVLLGDSADEIRSSKLQNFTVSNYAHSLATNLV